MKTPCIVITRDRISYTRQCLESLVKYSDQLDIHLVDHGSTWEEMLPLLNGGAFQTHRRGNEMPRSLWEWSGLKDIVGDKPYIVTDPDVVLDPMCPADWIERLYEELSLNSGYTVKAGLGLRLDDLPEDGLGPEVRKWESQFWETRSGPNLRSWVASVDTTLALYRPLYIESTFWLGPATRLDSPYLLRHLPWYGDLDQGETDYYRAHALPGSSHWINGGW